MAKQFDFVKNRKKFFIFSACLMVAIALATAVFGVKLDIQFSGGTILTYSYEGDIEIKAVEQRFEELLGQDVTLQSASSIATGQQLLKVTKPGGALLAPQDLAAVEAGVQQTFAANNFNQMEASNVNPVMGREFLAKSVVAVIVASLLILFYIMYRFSKIGGLPGGIAAVIALLHDLIIIYGVFVVLRIPLSGNFIAAVLTILGYSINDTVVIYDRIRENRGNSTSKTRFGEIVNKSINQSFVRSMNTTITTVLALVAISAVALVYNLNSLFTFTFPLIFGMVSGVYSSICIATPLWTWWEDRKIKTKK